MKALVNSLFSFEINDESALDIVKVRDDMFNIIYNERSFMVCLLSNDKKNKAFEIVINNNIYAVQLKDDFDELLLHLGVDIHESNKDKDVVSPMPGRVVEVFVSAGDSINEGDGLVVLEAMKMENVIKATKSGVLKGVYASAGDSVEKNSVLLSYK
tara:strand:+ start:32759 stop:33226 length:468 start_codon:yes stop_codon:yes gene_type:complete